MPQKIIFIYGLCDPRKGYVRYVGKSNDPKRRLKQHIFCARQAKYRYPLYNWIRKLLSQGIEPIFIILEEVGMEDWKEAEQHWITHYHRLNGGVLNVGPGGEGVDERHYQRGIGLHHSTLTEAQVMEMRELRHQGMLVTTLAKRFGVHIATVSEICRGKFWKHVGGPLTTDLNRDFVPTSPHGSTHHMSKLSEDQVREIRTLFAEDTLSAAAIARIYGIAHKTACGIRDRKIWKHLP